MERRRRDQERPLHATGEETTESKKKELKKEPRFFAARNQLPVPLSLLPSLAGAVAADAFVVYIIDCAKQQQQQQLFDAGALLCFVPADRFA